MNDPSTELELLYIDDLVEGMFDLLEGKEQHCEFDGVETVADEAGRYCYVPVTHKVTLGEIVDLLQQFKEQPVTLTILIYGLHPLVLEAIARRIDVTLPETMLWAITIIVLCIVNIVWTKLWKMRS